MRRFLALLMLICLCVPALAEDLTLPTADTVAEVNSLIDLPDPESIPVAQAGRIRFVSLNARDAAFHKDLWANEQYDLTVKGSYRSDCRNMHDRAVYSMALSYLGVDVSPVMMSQLAGSRDVSAPFDEVTAQLPGVERVEYKAHLFDSAVENYMNDPAYSPVMVKIRRPEDSLHTVLVVGYIPSTGGFIICDPAAPAKDGSNLHAYKMAWHVVREVVLASDFWDMFYGSTVMQVYQWRLTDTAE